MTNLRCHIFVMGWGGCWGQVLPQKPRSGKILSLQMDSGSLITMATTGIVFSMLEITSGLHIFYETTFPTFVPLPPRCFRCLASVLFPSIHCRSEMFSVNFSTSFWKQEQHSKIISVKERLFHHLTCHLTINVVVYFILSPLCFLAQYKMLHGPELSELWPKWYTSHSIVYVALEGYKWINNHLCAHGPSIWRPLAYLRDRLYELLKTW